MSHKKHKGDHGKRAEQRARTLSEQNTASATIYKPRRVFLRNGLYIFLTLLIIIAVGGVLVGFQWLGWWDTLIGSVLSVFVAAFGVMCIVDLGLLLTTCISFGEGMVNLGKNQDGHLMVFHASSVIRLELVDKSGQVLPNNQPVYQNIELIFVMESGRQNRRALSRLTAKQLSRIEAALDAERAYREQN